MLKYIYQAFGWVLRFCYSIVPNYAIALLLFAILIKVLLFPLGIKQQKNLVKQAMLRPKELAIRRKYAGRNDKATQQKVNEEVMNLYQQENFNPMSGCLPLLIQIPIIFILYQVIQNPLKYIMMLSGEQIEKAKTIFATFSDKVVAYDLQMVETIRDNFSAFADVFGEKTLADLPNFSIFGGALDLSKTPEVSFTWLALIPVLVFVSQLVSMKLTRKFTYQPPQQGDAGMSMKIMDWTMPLFSVFLAFSLPAVLGVYWIYQSLLTVAQQYLLYKMYPTPTFTEEETAKMIREFNSGKSSEPKKDKPKSLHSIQYDDVPEEPEKKPAGADALSSAPLKDERDRAAARASDPNKKKVRSLHHIDSPGYENGYKIDPADAAGSDADPKDKND